MCLAQIHNAVTPVMLEQATPLSRVKHSTTGLPTLRSDAGEAPPGKPAVSSQALYH